MRLLFVELNPEEAKDRTLMEVLDRFCVGVSLAGAAVVKSIGPDAPDVGVEVELNRNAPGPWNPDGSLSPSPLTVDTTQVGFGTPAPSTAAAAPSTTAPVGLPVSAPVANVNPLSVQLPVPPVVAPTAPVTPTNPAGGVELDSTGLPWDGRIHSSKKSKTDNGQWRAKKGLNDPAMVKAIEAQLRSAMTAQAPAAPVAPPPAPVIAPAVQQQMVDVVAAQAAAALAVPVETAAAPSMLPPALPPAAPAPAPVAPPAGPTMASLMAKLSPHMTSGLLSPERQGALFQLVGVNSLPELMPRPDLIAKLEPAVDGWIAYWQGLQQQGHGNNVVKL